MAKKKAAPKIDPYIDGLMGKLLERLTTLERKVDVVISKLGQKPSGNGHSAATPAPAQTPAALQPPRRERQLYEAICADCSKVCEVPFRPTENRPVYCKECWAVRRNRDKHPGMPVLTPVKLPPKPTSVLGAPAPAAVATAAGKKPGKPGKPAKTAKKSKKR